MAPTDNITCVHCRDIFFPSEYPDHLRSCRYETKAQKRSPKELPKGSQAGGDEPQANPSEVQELR